MQGIIETRTEPHSQSIHKRGTINYSHPRPHNIRTLHGIAGEGLRDRPKIVTAEIQSHRQYDSIADEHIYNTSAGGHWDRFWAAETVKSNGTQQSSTANTPTSQRQFSLACHATPHSLDAIIFPDDITQLLSTFPIEIPEGKCSFSPAKTLGHPKVIRNEARYSVYPKQVEPLSRKQVLPRSSPARPAPLIIPMYGGKDTAGGEVFSPDLMNDEKRMASTTGMRVLAEKRSQNVTPLKTLRYTESTHDLSIRIPHYACSPKIRQAVILEQPQSAPPHVERFKSAFEVDSDTSSNTEPHSLRRRIRRALHRKRSLNRTCRKASV